MSCDDCRRCRPTVRGESMCSTECPLTFQLIYGFLVSFIDTTPRGYKIVSFGTANLPASIKSDRFHIAAQI